MQAPTFRKVHIGDNAATSKTLSTEPYRPGPPHTGPGQLTNEVVTAKVRGFRCFPVSQRKLETKRNNMTSTFFDTPASRDCGDPTPRYDTPINM